VAFDPAFDPDSQSDLAIGYYRCVESQCHMQPIAEQNRY
jgi:hypothetical protein